MINSSNILSSEKYLNHRNDKAFRNACKPLQLVLYRSWTSVPSSSGHMSLQLFLYSQYPRKPEFTIIRPAFNPLGRCMEELVVKEYAQHIPALMDCYLRLCTVGGLLSILNLHLRHHELRLSLPSTHACIASIDRQ